jgi:putative glycosyltransferase (TIGR04348 family)
VPFTNPLRIGIVSPVSATPRSGNAVTASRYARFFRSAGHLAHVIGAWNGEPFDLLVALHARKSARSVLAFTKAHPDRPAIVVLTGTDLYRDLRRSRLAQRAIAAAAALVTLQEDGVAYLPRAQRGKATAIVQSAMVPKRPPPPRSTTSLTVCAIGHMRFVKDPMRVGCALRSLRKDEPISVVQAGAALEERYALAARRLERDDRRYRWIGDVSHARAVRLLQRSDLLAISSRAEGGANVVCEAIAVGTPVIASRISGNVGLLGRDYPALFRPGDTAACAALMLRALHDPAFSAELRRRVRALQPLVRPQRERRLWLALVNRTAPRRPRVRRG